ncbi:hypothetical protein [Vibrio cholerae]|uniref:Uncharacterized protein n=1 Tax=Vibrio cholerae TaxID=666 RepID=A0ABD7SRT1_VIBCL|nr:hypothetical protein [Vibrio cholerae]TXX67198.1 hypothetical protein FXF03_01105 [Vibrio cholerae]GIA99643.1 hypothetical protein VCSRO136_2392 [Vibrio cholerae]HDI3250125.1 hypothetical protein [Vibrio cholerae]
MNYPYISIDEGYFVTGLKNLDAIVAECVGLYTEQGDKVTTKSQAKELLSESRQIRLYEYDEDELVEIKNGKSLRKDWILKIIKL